MFTDFVIISAYGAEIMLDVGLYQLNLQVACQRIDKILDANVSIRERLAALNPFKSLDFATALA